MPYDDFTKRTWKVKLSTTQCQAEEIIRIDGPENEVTVQCGKNHPYGPAIYVPQEDAKGERIERKDEYTITIIAREPKYEIEATFMGVIGGSWTAEDNTGGAGGG
ncbi:MAG TPA: hypothetical protein VGH73_20195 [Thermoanaerobaculia bacterium]|jgi:hypothetical protein